MTSLESSNIQTNLITWEAVHAVYIKLWSELWLPRQAWLIWAKSSQQRNKLQPRLNTMIAGSTGTHLQKKYKPNKRKPVELQVFVHKKTGLRHAIPVVFAFPWFLWFPCCLGGKPPSPLPFFTCKSPKRRGPNHFNGLRVVMELWSREGLNRFTNIAKSKKRFVPKTLCWSEDLPRPRKVAKIHFLRLSLHSVNMS